jgi:hypothetical protein
MKLWKAWFDIRQRFFLCVVLVTLLMAPEAVSIAVSSSGAAAAAEASGAMAEPETLEAAHAFGRMLEGWIGGNAHYIFAILAIVLAVGGILSTGNARSNLMTLSLPTKRSHWLTAQATMAALLTLTLCGWEATIMACTGWLTGLEVPLGRLLLAVVLTSLTASIWIWPAVLSTAFTRESVRAALIVVSTLVALQTILSAVGRQDLGMGPLADVPGWADDVPWAPLLIWTLFAGGSALWALHLFRKMEF